MRFPEGYISNGMLIYGSPISRNSIVAKGAIVTLPDISSFSENRLEVFRETVQAALSMLGEAEALQVQWSVESNYEKELSYYEEITSAKSEIGRWSQVNREMLAARYRTMMEDGELRKEKIVVFFTRRCDTLPKGRLTASLVAAFLETVKTALENRIQSFKSLFSEGAVVAMDDDDHYLYLNRFFNRDSAGIRDEDLIEGFDRYKTIGYNCIQSDAVSQKLEDGTNAFKFDGRFHAVFAIKRWPTKTTPLVMQNVLEACNRDFCITASVIPLDIVKEIETEDRIINRLERMQSDKSTASTSADAAIDIRRAKVASLSSGDIIPLECLYLLRIFADDLKTLQERCVSVKTAMAVSGGMKYHEVNLGTQAQSLFYATFPGWTGAPCRGWGLYAENTFLADLLPLQCSFVGRHLPEAIYMGENNNLAGVQLFVSGTPQHAFLIGMTRSGKSVLMIDLLTQTDPHFDFTAIIEEGLSYGTYTQLNDCEPIIIGTDSKYVFNPFDTQGLPLTGEHLNAAVALFGKMIGSSGVADIDRRRFSMIGEYVQRLYEDAFDSWLQRNDTEELKRDALACYTWYKEKMPAGAAFIEAFSEYRQLEADDSHQWQSWRMRFSKENIIEFSQEPTTARICRDYLFSAFKATDFPTLSALVEAIEFNPLDKHSVEETNHLATMLAGWTLHKGSYGGFFDGASNFSPKGKIVHFELGTIGKGATALKECAGFLVAHWVRQHIVGLPRNVKKRVIFEEGARFFDIPDGDKIIEEYYAQLGKYSCWICLITQVYAQLKKLPIKGKIIGNTSLFIILKQKDKEDLEDLSDSIGIPESAQRRILSYVIPANQHPRHRASYFTILCEGENGMMCGGLKCVATAPLIYAASSTGSEWEARRNDLSKYSDTFEGVLAETEKQLSKNKT